MQLTHPDTAMVRALVSVEIPLVSAKGTRVKNRYSSRALALVDCLLRSPQRLHGVNQPIQQEV